MTERQPTAGNPSLGRLPEARRSDKNQRCRVVVRFYNKALTYGLAVKEFDKPAPALSPGVRIITGSASSVDKQSSTRL